MQITEITFLVLLATVAFFYASVGHGGASGYLAIMALFSFAPETMRTTALTLNLFVALIAFIQFFRRGYFQWKLFWPLVVGSIPAAFLGGTMTIETGIYKKILSGLLLIPAFRLIGFKIQFTRSEHEPNQLSLLIIGVCIGLFSGMIGIGGGIILSPLLLFMKWADIKQTAAVSSLFIFFNSIAGLIGLYTIGLEYDGHLIIMILSTLSGAIAGSYLGSTKFNSSTLNKLLAFVLFIASIKLMFT